MRSGRQEEPRLLSQCGRQGGNRSNREDNPPRHAPVLLSSGESKGGAGGGNALPMGERAAQESWARGGGCESEASEAHLPERFQVGHLGREASGSAGKGGPGAVGSDYPPRNAGAGGLGSGKGARCAGEDENETCQSGQRAGEELWGAAAEMQRGKFSPASEGRSAWGFEGGSGTVVRHTGKAGDPDKAPGLGRGAVGEEVPRRRGRLAGERSGNPDGVGVPAHTRRQESIQEEPNRGGIHWPKAQEGPIRRHRQAATHHQSVRSLPTEALGELCEPNLGPLRQGHRPSSLGIGTGEPRREERKKASHRGGGAKAGGVNAQALGDR